MIGCRRHPSSADPTERTVTPDQLNEVIGVADVIVLAAPATPETGNLVDADFLNRTKPGSLLVNVARGALVDDRAPSSAWTPDTCPVPYWTCSGRSRFRTTTRSGHIRPYVSPPTTPPVASAGCVGRPSCSKRISTATWSAVRCSTR